MPSYPKIYLASTSPRRAQLLRQLDVEFKLIGVDVDETPKAGETPKKLVTRLAQEKARAGRVKVQADGLEDRGVLAADTLVALEGVVCGKPAGPEQAVSMLKRLSGKTHQVFSAVSVCWHEVITTELNITTVHFAILRDEQIRDYVQTGEPMDKAGAYAIQGLAAAFIERIEGSYSGVMGLPLAETHKLLQAVALIQK